MHAGDAIWFLHAELTMLERRYSTEPSTLDLLAKMREALGVVGTFVKVDPPPPEKMQQLIEAISSTMSQGMPEPQHEQPQSKGNRTVDFNDPERVEAAKEILEDMVGSGHFEWADLIDNVHSQVFGDSPFITDRQFRAIVNIGRKGDRGEYWDRLTDDHPESVKIAEEAAARA
jgi:hypothetical protein